jgi:hypothetical protein
MRRAFFAWLLLAFSAPLLAQSAAAPVTRVLFIGNSLVASNDVPGRLERLARAMGRNVAVEAVTANDSSLEDHWRDGRALARIREGWDFVVLQQGPSSQPGSRALLVEYARRFVGPIRAAGARPAIFTAWPAAARSQDFAGAIESHRLAAEAIDATLVPVAEAWLRAMSADRTLRLYADSLHASRTGSDLAVLTAWFALFPAGAQEFDDAYVERLAKALGIPAAQRQPLVDAATRAIDQPMGLR